MTAGEAEEQWPEGGADINDGYKFQQLFDVCLNFQNKDLGSVLPVKPSIRQPFSELRITVRGCSLTVTDHLSEYTKCSLLL